MIPNKARKKWLDTWFDIKVEEEKTPEVTEEEEEKDDGGWFKSSEVFDDGYQFGDVFKATSASAQDLGENISAGILGIGEKVVDAGATILGGVGGLFGADEFKDDMADFVAKDLYDERELAKYVGLGGGMLSPIAITNKILGLDTDEDSVFGEKADSLAQSGGELVGTIALQAVGVPWFVTTGVTSYGGAMEGALNEGASFEEAAFSSAITAGAEILTEKLFGGSGLGEKGLINLDGLTKGISSKVVKALADVGVDMAAEGSEEVVSSVVGRLASSLYREENLGDLLFSEEAVDEYIDSFIGGAVLGGVMNTGKAASSIKTGRDYRTGFTENEQKVFDKVYNDRVAEEEEGGNTLTKKQKAEIYDEVQEELQKGYISTDTIESVLGGDTYKSYKDTIDNEDAILKEYEELGKKQNATLAEQSRYAELKEMVKDIESNSKRSQLKTQLSKEVYESLSRQDGKRTRTDDFLIESYNERARRGMAFEADLSKYDKKTAETVKRAVESGILNNTRRTHEFVDMVAKISADKGVSFDFTNNAKLKESGFAIDGKVVNGYVTKDGIAVNIDSRKSLNSVVGHEISHVLEGTELYTEMQKALFEYAKSKKDYASRRKALEDLYKDVEGADVDAELTADLVGDYLFTDEDFIRNLSTKNRNVFQKIYDEIKYLCKIATAGSKEARELEKVKRAFDKVYRESAKTESETKGKTEYSLSGITEDGIEVYETSQDIMDLTWDERKAKYLDVMKNEYRGRTAKFERNGHTYYAEFDQNSIRKHIYGDKRSSPNGAKALIKAGADGDVFTLVENSEYRRSRPNTKDHTDADYFDYFVKTVQIDGKVFDLVADVEKKYGDDGGYVYTLALTDNKKNKASTTHGTSPVKNVVNASEDIISQNSEKSIGNSKFSLSAEQQEYFKDSVVRDESGDLKVMYHGTSKGGHTVFDTFGSNYGLFGQGSYFTDDKSVAESYTKKGKGNNPQVYESYLNITNPMDMDAEADIKAWMKAVPDADFSGCVTNEDCYRAMEEYLMDEEYSKWEAAEFATDSVMGMGYDGITHIGGGRFNKADDTRHQVYIAFNPEQIKNIDNVNPTDNPDIRYSLSNETDKTYLDAVERGDTDTVQRMVDEAASEAGYKKLFYHGTASGDFTKFASHGKPMWITEHKDYAEVYANTKRGTGYAEDKRVMPLYAKMDNVLDLSQIDTMDRIFVFNAPSESLEKLADIVGVNTSELEKICKGTRFEELWELVNTKQFADLVREKGYDTIKENEFGNITYGVLDPTQLKSADAVTYRKKNKVIPLSERFNTENEDIRYSLSNPQTDKDYLDAVNRGDAETAQKIVEDVAKEAGYTIRAYHGTGRSDRVGNVFRPDRATSGPMAFFTDNKDIADNYARNKADTSLAYDTEYDSYYTQFRVNRNGKNISIPELWNYLSFSERNKIKEKAKHIKFDDDYEAIIVDTTAEHGNGAWDAYTLNIHRGNALEALVDTWLETGDLFNREADFLEVLEHVGIRGVEYRNPDARYEKTYDTWLKIQNPFDTDNANQSFYDSLSDWIENHDMSVYEKESSNADFWDKNNQSPDSWLDKLSHDIENGTTHAWTVIPDFVTDYLKQQGYDGIKDKGGKGGGAGHTVWIPFSSEQVKSAEAVTYDDNGNVIPLAERFNAENNDIRYSVSAEGEYPIKHGTYNVYGKDVALEVAPKQEDIAPVQEGVSKTETTTEDFAPITEEEANAMQRENLASIDDADAPPEMDAPYYENDAVTVDDPFEDRDIKSVGNQKVKAYMYENPEVKPFFQAEANVMLGELRDTVKGERWVNADVYYETNGEAGIDGTSRHTTADIAYLRDNLGYTYDEIEKGLNAIVEDNGKENNACSKRIEFLLNDRLMNGYQDLSGYDIPASQDYINLLNDKQITEYSEEARKSFFESVGASDIAPTREYEAIKPRPEKLEGEEAQWAANKMSRVDKANTEEQPTKKRILRKDLHRGIIDRIKAKFKDKGLDFDEVLKKAKDLSTFATVDNTPQRVMEKSLGCKEGQILADETVNKVAQNETEGIKWLNSFTNRKNGLLAKISRQYNIKPGSKESAAAQMYAEGFYVDKDNNIVKYGDEELAKDFPNAQVRKNIKGLAGDQRIRQIYDETLKAINESRVRNGYPEIPRLDNYFLHFRAMDDTFSRIGLPFNPNDIRAKDLPTDLNGVTADLKPGQPYFASAKHREGKRTSFDLLGGLERYLSSAKNQIYHIDDIQTLRALRNYIADTYGQANGLEGLDALDEEAAQEKIKQVYGSHLSTFAKFLNEEANVIAGKTALIDRGVEGIIGRRGITFIDTINRQVGSNMIGFNVSSSLTNLLSGVQAIAKTDKSACIKALAQTTTSKIGSIFGKTDSFVENNPTLIRRKGAERFYRTPFQKVGDAGYVLMGAVDNVTSEFIVRAKYNEFIEKGMTEEQAIIEADKWTSRLMGDRSLGQQPQIFNSKMLGTLTKFQLEVRNQLDSQFYDTIQEAKASNEDIENGLVRNAKTAAKVTATLFELAVLQHLFGKAFESVAGYNPAFDIISVLIKTLGFDDDEESEDTMLDNIEQGFLELVEDLPYTSTFTGGRIPISSALPISELIKGEDEYGNEKSRLETLGEIAPYYLLPTGYGQVKKTMQGLSMFDEDHPVAGSYTDSGNLRFPVEDTLGNRVQAGLFGQWASENARDYFDNERKPLTPKQTQEYIDVDMPIRDYWEYREGLSGLNTVAQKADYIDSLDLTVRQKNILINNATNRDEDIDMSDYGEFRNFNEFEFAKKYPEKYSVAKSVGGYKAYKKYKSDLYDIKADRTEDGKTISGSRKEKVAEYINNLDADYGEKIILFKSEYKADDRYNYDIIEYLNSREDISYEEMVAILKELGFKVSPAGNVTWD